MKRVVFIDCETGEVAYLDNPQTAAELADVCGEGSKSRASHVEPTRFFRRLFFHLLRRVCGETGRVSTLTRSRLFGPWRVNLSPVNGPILPTNYNDREQAINAEIEWLNEHPENWVFTL